MKRPVNSFAPAVVALVASASLLSGCGGGGGSAAGPSPAAPATTAPQSMQQAKLILTFPVGNKTSSDARRPQYVSPSSTQLEVKVNTINGSPPSSAIDVKIPLVFTAGGNCTVTSGTATCTLSIPAPPGNDNYTFSAEDGSNNILATVTAAETMTVGQNNSVSITMNGVVQTVTVSGALLSANDTSHATTGETLTVSAFDADSNHIVDGTSTSSYANPITLTDNDATGQTKLKVNGSTASSSVTVNKPSDVVTLTYTGQAANPFTVTASGSGSPGPGATITGSGTISTMVNDITFTTGTTLDDAAHGGLSTDANWGQQTVFFLAPSSGSQAVTAQEVGFTTAGSAAAFGGQFIVDRGNGSGGTCGSSSTIATVTNPTTPATTFTITSGSSTGVCSMRFEESGAGYPIEHTTNSSGSATHDGTFWISVTASNVTVNGKRRSH